MGKLDGKVCVITGGNSGVGVKTGKLFAEEGAAVVLMDNKDSHREKIIAAIRKTGAEGLFIKGKTTVLEDVKNVFKTAVGEFGHVDALVNCAGRFENNSDTDDGLTDEDYNLIISNNLRGTINMTREALSYMKALKKGSIVNVTSFYTPCGKDNTVYAASKAVVIEATCRLALCFAGTELRCNAIAPETGCGQGNRRGLKEAVSETDREICRYFNTESEADRLFRISRDTDVANIALFLASDESRSLTGRIIGCDFCPETQV